MGNSACTHLRTERNKCGGRLRKGDSVNGKMSEERSMVLPLGSNNDNSGYFEILLFT